MNWNKNALYRDKEVPMINAPIDKADLRNENEIKVRQIEDDSQYTGKLCIFEGQHRFHLAVVNEASFYYRFTGMDKSDIGMLATSQTPWSLEDSLRYYKVEEKGNSYKVLGAFQRQYKYPISTLIGVLSGQQNRVMLEDFRMGNFKVTQSLDFIHDILSKVQEFKQFSDRIYRNRTFLNIYIDLMHHPEFDHKQMIQKVQKNPGLFIFCNKKEDYLRMLESIYNHQKQVKVRFF